MSQGTDLPCLKMPGHRSYHERQGNVVGPRTDLYCVIVARGNHAHGCLKGKDMRPLKDALNMIDSAIELIDCVWEEDPELDEIAEINDQLAAIYDRLAKKVEDLR
jgi:hypothetical protein